MKTAVEGPVHLVTGAGSGIGRAAARRLADTGFVFGIDRDEAALDAFVNEFPESVQGFVCDIRDNVALEAVAAEIEARVGHVNCMFANAGIDGSGALQSGDPYDWERVMSTNMLGTYRSIRAFLPLILKARGQRSIVAMSSILATAGAAEMTAYSASKAGISGLVRSLAQELAGYEVTVNAVAPGPVRTGMLGRLAGHSIDETEAMVPLGRVARPEDIAGIVSFLFSRDAGLVTGQTIIVDGGLASRAYWRSSVPRRQP